MLTVDLVADFLAARRGRRAPNTLAAYRGYLRHFAAAAAAAARSRR